MMLIILIISLINVNSLVSASKCPSKTAQYSPDEHGLDNLNLEQLKNVCFPQKDTHRGMKNTTYTTLYGNEVARFLQSLQALDVRKLHITIKGAKTNTKERNTMDLSGLQHLRVEDLWIVPSENKILEVNQAHVFKIYLDYQKHLDSPSLSLRRLHMNVALSGPNKLVTLIQATRHLRILSLIGLQRLHANRALDQIMIALAHQPIVVLRLDQFQTNDEFYESEINSTQLFTPLKTSSLECISLKHNGLRHVTAGITEVLPKIRIIDVSENYLFNEHNEALLSELLYFTHSVELINVSKQGDFQPSHNRYKRKVPVVTVFKTCLKHLNTNIIEVSQNDTLWCETIQCMDIGITKHLPCSLIPNLQEIFKLYDISCTNSFKLPFSQNLKEIYLDYISPMLSVSYNTFDKIICLAQNNLTTFVMSHSEELLKETNSVDIMTLTFTGLTQLSFLDLSFNGLSIPIYNNSFLNSVPGLQKLYIQGNLISFGKDISSHTSETSWQSLCTKTFPHLGEVDFSHANISLIPQNVFYNCSYITRINLAENSLTQI